MRYNGGRSADYYQEQADREETKRRREPEPLPEE